MKRLEQVLVTKEQAALWLARKTGQRQLSARVVLAYRGDMDTGAWNTEAAANPILITEQGECIGGQHRLSALVQSKLAALPMWVLLGADMSDRKFAHGHPESIAHRIQQFSDVRVDGMDAKALVALTSHWNRLTTQATFRGQATIHDVEQLVSVLEPDIVDCVARTNQSTRKIPMLTAFVYAAHMLPQERDVVLDMLDQIKSKVGLVSNTATWAVVQWLERNDGKMPRKDYGGDNARLAITLGLLRAIRSSIQQEQIQKVQIQVNISWSVLDWFKSRSQLQLKKRGGV